MHQWIIYGNMSAWALSGFHKNKQECGEGSVNFPFMQSKNTSFPFLLIEIVLRLCLSRLSIMVVYILLGFPHSKDNATYWMNDGSTIAILKTLKLELFFDWNWLRKLNYPSNLMRTWILQRTSLVGFWAVFPNISKFWLAGSHLAASSCYEVGFGR